MEETYQALLDLQELDREMAAAREQVRQFEPELAELNAPVEAAEQEVEAVRKKLEELRTEARRLERGAQDKAAQLERYQDHLARVRNVREEAAARAEIDLISGAVQADEDDAVRVLEQVTRTELKLDELEKRLAQIRAETDPKRQELLQGREAAAEQVGVLESKRENYLVRMSKDAAHLYERIRTGKTKVALAALTADGACGHCFNVIPLQEQNEIRRREALHRCEACGVILYSAE